MKNYRSKARQFLHSLGPAVPAGTRVEALRASTGALIGLAVAAMIAPTFGFYMIAPFGATAVLLFAVPNSPLAQPWSAVVGNTVSAAVGVAVCLLVPQPVIAVAVAVGFAIAAMILTRAVHPPGGAVAMTAALSPDIIHEMGFRFVLGPVALGTITLVLIAIAYARMTGRHYPLRPFADKGQQDPPPTERIGLSEEELTGILQNYRQSLNLGVEDLARLIGAAEIQAAGQRSGAMTAQDIMSRDLVTVDPDTPLAEVATLFRRHGFTALPVVQEGDKFLGIIFQIHLIRRASDDAFRLDRGFASAMARLTDRKGTLRASEVMAVAMPRATPATPVAALLPMMADGACDAVPVLARGRIVGIVTRTDMIAALARQGLRQELQ